jgi:hypothetical protein
VLQSYRCADTYPAPDTAAGPAERSIEGLQHALEPVLGVDALRALLTRSVALARVDLHWLEGVEVAPDGSLAGLRERLRGREVAEQEAACTALLAHFLGLLAAFVGLGLVRRLIGIEWDEVDEEDAASGAEEAGR